MTWEDLNILVKFGWEIGSHAHSHIHLSRYSIERQEMEIARSITEIESHTGLSPVSFAYPYGSFSQETQEVLRRKGLRYAGTANAAASRQMTGDNLLELDRVAIGGRSFHHYFKSVYRTLKAIGLRSLFPRPSSKTIPSANTGAPLTAFENAADG